MITHDRTVHAILADGSEIVRYNRAGKWYQEYVTFRTKLNLAAAVDLAVREAHTVFLGRSGGSQFDRRYRSIKGIQK